MKEFLLMFLSGLFTFVAGILALKRDNRLLSNSVFTTARVVDYYEHHDLDNTYTMIAEYTLPNGTHIHSKEKKSSTRRKYSVGTEIEIIYSVEKPDFFIVRGDYSRKVILIGMIIAGPLLIALSFFVLFRK